MLFATYLYWHYAIAPIEILKLMKNYIIATARKFLIWGHLKTLFYPWHRLRVSDVVHPKNIADRVTNLVVEAYIRLIAAFIRLVVIFMGLIAEMLVISFFFCLFIAWLAWPAILFISITKGIQLLNVF